ncbi:gliding motility-associated C-terminal domain-containing protein [Taibaiella koreensis]|uniref:gliding motility-associated C-terminal domain-containing protein n=1 Tax=Taibaiella koreensis TaxID=1268548 RepID=UPI000E59C068|nr:gliding motility-associated C-terminal domain-containing protein [Taibaiella koreensis]
MKTPITLLILLLAVLPVMAQNNVWIFPRQNGMNFDGGTAQTFTFSQAAADNFTGRGCAASVSDGNGGLLFYTDGRKIWNRHHAVMPDGSLAPNLELADRQGCLIVPVPNDTNLYYVFSLMKSYNQLSNTRLFYSVVDRRLDNGLGDVVPGQKWLQLDEFLAEKMLAVEGDRCNIWLIVRDKQSNHYKAYEINRGGIMPNPVLSNCGTMPLASYLFRPLKSSPDRKTLAASLSPSDFNNNQGVGIELYDFNAATGQISNPRMIDAGLTGASITTHFYSDICFSPDGSKLYANAVTAASMDPPQYIFQYNLTLPTAAAIQASRQVVAFSQAPSFSDPGFFRFWDLENGGDGKIYCVTEFSWEPIISPRPLAVIQQPNLAGMACNVQIDARPLSNTIDFPIGRYSLSSRVVQRPMFSPDTLKGRKDTLICSREDTVLLNAGPYSPFYHWDNGDTGRSRRITASGTYIVRYMADACTDKIDSIHVRWEHLPVVAWDSAGCTAPRTAKAYGMAQDSTLVTYTWSDAAGIFQTGQSRNGDTVSGLLPGNYSVHLRTASGCDTTVAFTIQAYPEPVVTVAPSAARLRYGDSLQLSATGALFYAWWPSGTVSNDTSAQPYVRPLAPVVYTVMGLNEYGCRDTATANIDIDYGMPQLIPNAFSPNGDGRNDIFKIEGITYQKLVSFRIFNRWGQQVFETSDPGRGWDGSMKGRPCNTDTYYYVVSLGYPDGALKTFKGDLVLVR